MTRLGIAVFAAVIPIACGSEDAGGAGALPFVVDARDVEYRGEPAILEIVVLESGTWASFSFVASAEGEGFWVVQARVAGEELHGDPVVVPLDPAWDGRAGKGLLMASGSPPSPGNLSFRVEGGVASGGVSDSHGEGVLRFRGPVEVLCWDNTDATLEESFVGEGCTPYADLKRR